MRSRSVVALDFSMHWTMTSIGLISGIKVLSLMTRVPQTAAPPAARARADPVPRSRRYHHRPAGDDAVCARRSSRTECAEGGRLQGTVAALVTDRAPHGRTAWAP